MNPNLIAFSSSSLLVMMQTATFSNDAMACSSMWVPKNWMTQRNWLYGFHQALKQGKKQETIQLRKKLFYFLEYNIITLTVCWLFSRQFTASFHKDMWHFLWWNLCNWSHTAAYRPFSSPGTFLRTSIPNFLMLFINTVCWFFVVKLHFSVLHRLVAG